MDFLHYNFKGINSDLIERFIFSALLLLFTSSRDFSWLPVGIWF